MDEKLIELAVDVVDAFDQANTNKMVEIGPYGSTLKGAVEKLRELLNKDKQRTILSKEQAAS